MLKSGHGYFSRFLRTLAALTVILGALSACSGESDTPAPGNEHEDAPSQGTGAEDTAGGACNVVPTTVTGLDQSHVAVCSEVSYPDNPPAGGSHYSQWAAFQSYSFPVPRGFWVHDMEHGAVVYSYNCPDGCAEEVAQVQALIDALPSDPLCSAETPRRVLLTPDPLLD